MSTSYVKWFFERRFPKGTPGHRGGEWKVWTSRTGITKREAMKFLRQLRDDNFPRTQVRARKVRFVEEEVEVTDPMFGTATYHNPAVDQGEVRRDQITEFVRGFWADHERGPTMTEIGAAVELSPNSVTRQVNRLVKEGRLVRGAGQRSIRVPD